MFACGGNEDGCVRLWDFRKPSEIMETVRVSILIYLLPSLTRHTPGYLFSWQESRSS